MTNHLTLKNLDEEFAVHSNGEKAVTFSRFFKTKPGQYGHGDQFLGLSVPITRAIIKNYHHLSLSDIATLMKSPYHEKRLGAMMLLTYQAKKATDINGQKKIADFYLKNITGINNWDLVDVSAEHTVGKYLSHLSFNEQKKFLAPLIKSPNLWARRIGILATFYFIKIKDPQLALFVIKALLSDKQDLIHKATGWMLREIGKRCDEKTLTTFLNENIANMPRTALRYAIERLPEKTKSYFMKLPRKIIEESAAMTSK